MVDLPDQKDKNQPISRTAWNQIDNEKLIDFSEQIKNKARNLGEEALSQAEVLSRANQETAERKYITEIDGEAVAEIRKTAIRYQLKYKREKDMRHLAEKAEQLVTRLGMMIYEKYRIENKSWDVLLSNEDIADKIRSMANIYREMIKLGEKLEKS